MRFTLDDKKANELYSVVFCLKYGKMLRLFSLLPARVKAPQVARTPKGCIIAPLENLRELQLYYVLAFLSLFEMLFAK